jgi:hypothetical protein
MMAVDGRLVNVIGLTDGRLILGSMVKEVTS